MTNKPVNHWTLFALGGIFGAILYCVVCGFNGHELLGYNDIIPMGISFIIGGAAFLVASRFFPTNIETDS